jgi:hypothetical protein
MEVITRTEIFDFIWNQPIYFAIPLTLLFIVFCALVVIGGYSLIIAILKNAEELSDNYGLSPYFALIVEALGFISLYIAITFTDLLN